VGKSHSFGYRRIILWGIDYQLNAMKIDVNNFKDRIRAITEGTGFELVELTAPVIGGRLILRITIHSLKGVTLDNCAEVSRAVSDMLDTEDLIASRYTLEVSSLGLERPLLTPKDFMRRIGERVKVNYRIDGQNKVIEGILEYSDDANIKIDVGDEVITIPVDVNPRGKIVI
jgi:ribosome maturation factor RimP